MTDSCDSKVFGGSLSVSTGRQKMPYAELPGTTLWFTDTGRGEPTVLFLHALTGSTDSWAGQTPAFSKAGYRCVAYDRRGYGRSAQIGQVLEPGCGADDLHALAAQLNLRPFHLVGTAAGGAVALDFALSYAENLRSLVLADCVTGLEEPTYLAVQRSLRPPAFSSLPLDIREVGPSFRVSDPQGVRRWSEIAAANHHETAPRQQFRNHPGFRSLEDLQVPTLGLAGDADLAAPPALMRLFIRHIPNAEFATIPEAGHASFWEDPATWNRIVLEFIARH